MSSCMNVHPGADPAADPPADPTADPTKPRIGVSSCLLGNEVRYDGGHKRERFLTDELSQWVEWVVVCPEMEIGLGAPRERMRLVAGDDESIHLIALPSQRDLTDQMRTYAQERVAAFEDLDGFVLKSRSPSCGVSRVKIYSGEMPQLSGRGLFAEALLQRFDDLPVEEDGRLLDDGLREAFVEKIYAHLRWRTFLASDPTPGALVAFHAANKYALLARDEQESRALGRLVARAGTDDFDQVVAEYGRGFASAYRNTPTVNTHVNVMQHLAGMVKHATDSDDKSELVDAIGRYKGGFVPIGVPMALLRHHLRRHGSDWALAQTYLEPYPELLRTGR